MSNTGHNAGRPSSSLAHARADEPSSRRQRRVKTANGLPRQETIRSYLDRHGYEIGSILGEGSYSKVKACSRYSLADGSYMYTLACKMIDTRRASDDFVIKFLPRELQIMRDLNHPNVVRVWDIVHFQDHVYIFMDYCDGGDLLEHVRNHGLIAENLSRHYFRQLVSAVAYLHKMDIAHRDLKCENVLMTGADQIKISDFGFARYCHNTEGKRILSDTYCGSAAYAAPEILQGTSYNPKLYDMWSLGCVLFIMLTGHMPFDESDIPKMLKAQLDRNLTFPANVETRLSVLAKLLIRRLLEPDVTRRANVDAALTHDWTLVQPFRPPTVVVGSEGGDASRSGNPRRSSIDIPPVSYGRGRVADEFQIQTIPPTPIVTASLIESPPASPDRRHLATRARLSTENASPTKTPRTGTAKGSSILHSLAEASCSFQNKTKNRR